MFLNCFQFLTPRETLELAGWANANAAARNNKLTREMEILKMAKGMMEKRGVYIKKSPKNKQGLPSDSWLRDFLKLAALLKKPSGAGIERTDGARLNASTKAARTAYFDDLNAKFESRPIVFIANWDETSVGSRVIAGSMASRVLHGFVTGQHMVPQLPKVSYDDKTTLLHGVAIHLSDGVDGDKVKAAKMCPSMFIFTGEDSVPVPSDNELLPNSVYTCSPNGSMSKALYVRFL